MANAGAKKDEVERDGHHDGPYDEGRGVEEVLYGKGGMGGMEYARARVERARDERAKEVREESGRARVREGRTDAEQR